MADEEVKVQITGSAASLQDAARHAKDATSDLANGIRSEMSTAKDAIIDVGSSLNIALGTAAIGVIVAGIGQLSSKIQAFGAQAVEIRSFAQILHLTTTEFQGLGNAAEDAGVSQGKLFSATEKLVEILREARAGSSDAMEKLFSLGLSAQQIQDPTFQTKELIAALSVNLNTASTRTATMNALVDILGARMAQVAPAIAAAGGNIAEWNVEAEKSNALSTEQINHMASLGNQWRNMVQWIENATQKTLIWMDLHGPLTAMANTVFAPADAIAGRRLLDSAPTTPAAAGGAAPAKADHQENIAAAKADLKAQLEAIQLGLAAYKSGSAEKLKLLELYAELAKKYYGSADVDAVKTANAKVLEAQRQFLEEQDRIRKEADAKKNQADERQFHLQMSVDQQKAASAKALITAASKVLDEYSKLEEQSIEHRRNIAMEDAAWREQEIAALAEAGMISRREELEQTRRLEEERFRIQAQALRERIDLMSIEPIERAKAHERLELLELQHQRRLRAIDIQAMGEQQQAWRALWQNVGNSMQPVLARFLNMQISMKTMFQQTAMAIADTFAQSAARIITTMAAQAAAGKAIRLKEIAGDAYRAGAGAYAAMVGIPYVGPFIAPVAAAVAFGAVMAFGASAAGGYDIPAGTNPVTQLHAREMVLPEKHADVIRGMADGGGRKEKAFKVKAAGRGEYLIREQDLRRLVKKLGSQGAL